MDSTEPDWTSLPIELLAKIAKGLHTSSDALRFGAVCTKFLSSVLLSAKPQLPYNTIRIPFRRPKDATYTVHGHLVLVESAFYSIEPLPSRISDRNESTKPLIVKLEKSTLTKKMRVKEPLSRFRFKQLARSLPRSINLMDYQVQEMIKSYGLDFVAVRKRKAGDLQYDQLEDGLRFHKVVVATCLDEFYRDFAVMVIHSFAEVSLWRPGESEWINITKISGRKFGCEDVVYHNHNHKFYAVGLSGHCISIDHRASTISLAAQVLSKLPLGFKYLVSSLDSLFLVVKTPLPDEDDEIDDSTNNYGICMDIFKLDEDNENWVHVKDTLDDRIFFLGDDCSFSVAAKDFPALRNNSVYFNDDSFSEASEDHPGWYPGIYDLKHDIIGPISAFPQHSKIFWPSPQWLRRNPTAQAAR